MVSRTCASAVRLSVGSDARYCSTVVMWGMVGTITGDPRSLRRCDVGATGKVRTRAHPGQPYPLISQAVDAGMRHAQVAVHRRNETMRGLILSTALGAAALAGCYATGDVGYSASATYTSAPGAADDGYAATPDLVTVQPGVQVVADYDEPVFFTDGFYWRYYDGY